MKGLPVLAVLMMASAICASTVPFARDELADLPKRADGHELHVCAVKDTFLLGEPIMVEVFLHNVSYTTSHDPCILNPISRYIAFYAICPDSEAVRLRPEMHRFIGMPSSLTIPPKTCAGSVVIFGSKGLVTPSSLRGAGEYYAQRFPEPGYHWFVATYSRGPGPEWSIEPMAISHLTSNLDSFFVDEPSGWDRAVYEAIGDTLFSLESARPGQLRLWAEDWQKDPIFWERLCLMYSTSVYAPWLWAARARGIIMAGAPGVSGYEPAIGVLQELVRRFPGHRFSQEAEFSIAALLCAIGRGPEAKELLDRLLLKYPENIRSYMTCRERLGDDGEFMIDLRDEPVVRGSCPETP